MTNTLQKSTADAPYLPFCDKVPLGNSTLSESYAILHVSLSLWCTTLGSLLDVQFDLMEGREINKDHHISDAGAKSAAPNEECARLL